MAVCVHCSTPTKELFVSYGPDHLVCTRCPSCHAFADPYVEQEAVIVAIDLILVKPRAYRHLLFNRPNLILPNADNNIQGKLSENRDVSSLSSWRPWWRFIRHFFAYLLVDSYLRWFYLCAKDQTPQTLDSPLRTLTYQSAAVTSYLQIVLVTFLQLSALFLTTLLLSILYHRTLLWFSQRPDSIISKGELLRFRPHLVLTSLLLAHLTPIFLLSLLLLWHSKPTIPIRKMEGWQWDEDSIDWAIRSMVGGLSSGVALGVVLPLQKNKIGAFVGISILLLAWYVQIQVSISLQVPFHSGVGVLQTSIGEIAARRYCT